MSTRQLRRRWWPLVVVIDLVGGSISARRWSLLPIVAVVMVAAIAAFVSFTVVPWAIYPGL